MSWLGIFITYSVCWWLVLFMVLPWGVRMAEVPEKGHAVSAPIHFNLKKKLLITSLLTLIPTVAMYLVVSEARAKDPDIYHTSGAGGGCKPATMPNDAGELSVDVNVPTAPYYDASAQGNGNVPAAGQDGSLALGKAHIAPDGSMTLNGKSLGVKSTVSDCAR